LGKGKRRGSRVERKGKGKGKQNGEYPGPTREHRVARGQSRPYAAAAHQ
jgi:hypothetical protein